MRMAGVVVVDGDPIELGAEILLHLCHQPADEGFEIFVLDTVLGRDDEAELMAVAVAALEESLAVHPVLLRAIELPGLTITGQAVALAIAQLRLRSLLAISCLPDAALLEYDPAI